VNDSACLVPALLDQVRCIWLETVIVAPIGDCFDLSLSVGARTASMRGSGERDRRSYQRSDEARSGVGDADGSVRLRDLATITRRLCTIAGCR